MYAPRAHMRKGRCKTLLLYYDYYYYFQLQASFLKQHLYACMSAKPGDRFVETKLLLPVDTVPLYLQVKISRCGALTRYATLL